MAIDDKQTHRRVVSYIDKSREFYAAQGYTSPYRWASHASVPFATPPRLADARVGVVTTSFFADHSGRKDAFAAPSSPTPSAMFTADLSWDKDATHTDDVGSFLPLDALRQLASDGVIGALGPRFYGVPTLYSQRATRLDADRVLEWAREDDVDLLVLVPL